MWQEKLAGAALLAVGIWVSVDGSSFLKVLGPFSQQAMQFVNVGYFCIAVGAVLVLLGFLGCCGAQKESKCLLIMAEGILKAWATPALQKQYGKEPVVTKIWNTTMTELKCCGFTNYTDFTNSYYYSENGDTYPPTCCRIPRGACSDEAAYRSNVQGCFEQLLSTLKKNANIVGGIAAGICALEVAAMAVSMYLYCHLDKTTR
ncbi:hypothetical protein SKAU_G00068870 [Synaphobranchus kaupii]|uniref:Tetraspanin n=1 Tax=Synaphobranchus kaupii TaxID=118154 RepID=A0A9Q1JBI7_SYNKA|nr:hypothetical protein SKAU_G00068870 [Synaphobranchus kaupii]